MRADLSRGHRPDEKREQRYRRVLTQQGRLWLDSDVAASVDATDRLIRHVARDVGCPAGSPDEGYLASPGCAFAWFDSIDHVSGITALPFRAFRDYAKKYMERFASLYLDARGGAGQVTIRGRSVFDVAENGILRLWMSVAAGGTVPTMTIGATVIGPPAQTAGNFGFDAYDFDIAAAGVGPTYEEIILDLGAGASNEVWVGFIEARNQAALSPLFWTTAGSYYIDGLEVERTREEAEEDSSTLPDHAPLVAATRFVTYLEGWERLVTHVEEAGLRDIALGGLDSTVRTRPMGQVKVAVVPATALTLDELIVALKDAFSRINLGAGELTVVPAVSPPDPDPCAIPVEGGYNADENRLYRFEIHLPGDLGTTRVKWSRNNGSELYGSTVTEAALGLVEVTTTPGTAPPMQLLENDIVELIDEDIDLFDAARATFDLASIEPSVSPAQRRVGRLCFVKVTDEDRVYQLFDLDTQAQIDFTAVGAPPPPARLRKWDGVIVSTSPAPSEHTIEDGLDLTLEGSDFRAGDYWQFEARRSGGNAMSPWQVERHGPERLLAPLALFRIGAIGTDPVELEHWFDDRFRPICELRADDIYYDGDKSDTDADTVQEAIDELYVLVKEKGGCCDFTLKPLQNPGDDSVRIQTIIDGAAPKKKICLARGIYRLQKPLFIDKKDVTIEGCPEAIIEGLIPDGPMFQLVEKARLTLENLVIRGIGSSPIIELKARPTAGSPKNDLGIHIRRSKLVQVAGGDVIRDEGTALPTYALDTDAVVSPPPAANSDNILDLDVEHSLLAGRFAVLVHQARQCRFRDSLTRVSRAGVATVAELGKSGSSVRLERSLLSCSLDPASLAALAAATSSSLEEAIAAEVVFGTGAIVGSVGVAGYLATLEVQDSQVLADCSVALRSGALISAASSFSARRAQAVWMERGVVRANQTSFVGDEKAAVHLIRPSEMLFDGCTFSAPIGIITYVSTDLKTPVDTDAPLRIDIHRSRLRVQRASNLPLTGGILIGAGTRPALDALDPSSSSGAAQIVVSENLIELRSARNGFTFGVLVNLTAPAVLHPVQILHNTIQGETHTGITVVRCGARIESNELDLELIPETGLLLCGIAVFDGEGHVLSANSVVARCTDEDLKPIGILVVGFGKPSRTNVRSNQVRDRSTPTTLFPLLAAGLPRLIGLDVENNDLQGHEVWLDETRDVVVRGNRFDTARTIFSTTENLTLHDNVTDGPDEVGDVIVSPLSGVGRIAHNQCGRLRVRPGAVGAKEDPYRLHLADNVVRRGLDVGLPGGSPHPESRIQVLGNQAESIFVNSYDHAVVASNLAVNYAPPTLSGPSSPAPILLHNHNV